MWAVRMLLGAAEAPKEGKGELSTWEDDVAGLEHNKVHVSCMGSALSRLYGRSFQSFKSKAHF